ncbi:TrbI/VirB10 family protein [Vibrio echinoideorum]|uniref:TrbI/VirB10 family protein n=1 Tax=Vibrio echinoideorum TaxID=2100116 RepID=UPI00354C857C
MNRTLKRFFSRGEHESLKGEGKSLINEQGHSRNNTILLVLLGALVLVGGGLWLLSSQSAAPTVRVAPSLGEVLDDEYTRDDAQSAQRSNERTLDKLSKQVEALAKQNQQLLEIGQEKEDKAKEAAIIWQQEKDALANQLKDATQRLDRAITEPVRGGASNSGSGKSSVSASNAPFSTHVDPFDYPNATTNAPRYEENGRYQDMPELKSMKTLVQSETSMPRGIQTFIIPTGKKDKRSDENYVPAGSFVTAVMTGGASANAGVSGQSNTSPVLFEMLNGGFLPNGKHTKLKGCTMTGSAYGDISSSRGIVRGDRLSCIRKDGSVLDIPIEATVFNYGKNGIAGTAIMRNSKIIQSAGVAGLLTGLGNVATGMSQTQSTSALGSTTSVDPSKAGLNVLGTATSEVASKLSDYYLKLAEQYHPDIEIRQGAVVNIVFLKGFPLYDTQGYTQEMKKAEEQRNAVKTISSNPLAAIMGSEKQSLGKEFK